MDNYAVIPWLGAFWCSQKDKSGIRIQWHLRLKTVTDNHQRRSWRMGEDYRLAELELSITTQLEF
jgi:hypothetical protein|tara:strand:- start:117672 stop:117866 length:195 start_codon:yes stop_codon:yes gene_type:complete